MATQSDFDLTPNPIRAGAAPTLDVTAAGLRERQLVQPAWIRVTEGLVKIIRYHFSDATRIEFPDLIDRVWVPDQATAPIFISSLAEFAPVASQQRPAVLVDRLEQDKDMEKRGIGDQLMGIAPGRYAHYMRGRHVVHCLGALEAEAELLAAEVWRELVRFAPVIREALCLNQFIPQRVGKRVQLSDSFREHYTIPIEIAVTYEEAWSLRATDEVEVTAVRTMLVDPYQ